MVGRLSSLAPHTKYINAFSINFFALGRARGSPTPRRGINERAARRRAAMQPGHASPRGPMINQTDAVTRAHLLGIISRSIFREARRCSLFPSRDAPLRRNARMNPYALRSNLYLYLVHKSSARTIFCLP